jgi:hypothetical protein
MTSDYNGPATFSVEGSDHQIVVAVRNENDEASTDPFPTGQVTRATFTATVVQLVGGSLPDQSLDKTGELRCADGQEFTGEFNETGEFRIVDIS